MTATDLLSDLRTLTTIAVTEIPMATANGTALTAGHSYRIVGVITGETHITIHPYCAPGEPRPLPCPKHGAQRHDWDAWRKAYRCVRCAGEGRF